MKDKYKKPELQILDIKLQTAIMSGQKLPASGDGTGGQSTSGFGPKPNAPGRVF